MSLLDGFLEYSFMPMYGLVLLVSLWRYPRYYNSPLKFFPVLLMYTLLTETLGYLVFRYDEVSFFLNKLFRNYNWVIFNIYNLVFFLYFFVVFGYYLKKSWQGRFLLAGSLLLLAVSIFNALKSSFLLESQIYAYIAGGLVLIAAILMYLRQKYKEQGRIFDKGDLLSWLGLGMLFFYPAYIPIKVLRHYHALFQINDALLTRRVHLFLILLMYGCFIAGFLKMRERNGYPEKKIHKKSPGRISRRGNML